MPHAFPVEVPGGYWHGGARHRDAELRPLTGGDEAFLADQGSRLLPVNIGTVLLARTLARIGPCDAVDDEVVGRLTVGDREALLLHLLRITLGDRLQAVVSCPAAACAEKMDVDLSVASLLLPPYAECRPQYEVTVDGEEGSCEVVFRVPTGADLEAAAAASPRDACAGARQLLHACIREMKGEDGRPLPSVPPAVARALPAAMAERDPQAELELSLQCPRCGSSFLADLDVAGFLVREVGSSSARIYRDVHRMALHYHWSEADILSLSASRRRTYLALIAEGAQA